MGPFKYIYYVGDAGIGLKLFHGYGVNLPSIGHSTPLLS